MPRNSRRIWKTRALPSRSSDLAQACCLPHRVAGQTLSAGTDRHDSWFPGGPTACVLKWSTAATQCPWNCSLHAFSPLTPMPAFLATSHSGCCGAQRRTRITDVVLPCLPTRSTAIPCTFSTPRFASPGGISTGSAPSRSNRPRGHRSRGIGCDLPAFAWLVGVWQRIQPEPFLAPRKRVTDGRAVVEHDLIWCPYSP